MDGKATAVRFDGTAPAGLVRPAPGEFAVFAAARACRVDESVLSGDEAKRAAGFARAADRERYTVAHVMLRLLLAAYLGGDPAALPLFAEACPMCGGPHGRPAVAVEPRLHFSLSHGGMFALAAFASEPIGVDVEPVPEEAAIRDLLGCLDKAERREFDALPEAERPAGFARAWVRKEARLKALGTGLALDPAAVHTGLGVEPGSGVVDVAMPQGHAAAVAFTDR
jgi:4'-phosphopantetheinyl transferase